jgi:DNA-binding transcriptional regulator PaaX
LIRGIDQLGLIDKEAVYQAWNFSKIEEMYQAYEALLAQPLESRDLDWFRREHLLWKKIQALDPFLPKRLLPPTYPGLRIWKLRKSALAGN